MNWVYVRTGRIHGRTDARACAYTHTHTHAPAREKMRIGVKRLSPRIHDRDKDRNRETGTERQGQKDRNRETGTERQEKRDRNREIGTERQEQRDRNRERIKFIRRFEPKGMPCFLHLLHEAVVIENWSLFTCPSVSFLHSSPII